MNKGYYNVLREFKAFDKVLVDMNKNVYVCIYVSNIITLEKSLTKFDCTDIRVVEVKSTFVFSTNVISMSWSHGTCDVHICEHPVI